MIKYISTRGGGAPQSFEQVLLAGLAPDGGLYVPQTWPKLDFKKLKGKSYVEVAEVVIFPFVAESIDRETLRGILNETYGPDVFRHKDVAPLHKISGNLYALELFHGPTISRSRTSRCSSWACLFDQVLKARKARMSQSWARRRAIPVRRPSRLTKIPRCDRHFHFAYPRRPRRPRCSAAR
jgi:threonine synthase